jgi:hypothetical protein
MNSAEEETMHPTYTIDLARQRQERFEAQVAGKARHLAALRAACRRAPGLRGVLGACTRVAAGDR